MSQSSSEFYDKLYAIKPFKETESPPSSESKHIPDSTESYSGNNFCFKLPDPLPYFQPIKDLTPLRKVMSESCPSHSIQLFDESNSKTLTSISSTIDILFSKIEKIKQEFSYALQKPKSESTHQIDSNNQQIQTLFYSQKLIPGDNKQNQAKTEESNWLNEKASKKQQKNYSFPLTQHIYNSIIIDRFEHLQEIHKPKPTSKMLITDFHLGKCIGSGKFGDVYLCVHKITGFICAIKKIFKSTIRDYNMEEQFATELKIHYSLDHFNIIKLYGHFDDEYHVFLMMEYANDGTLMDKLKNSQQFVSKSIDQVLDAVSYMHRNKVIHRDIKPQNIVICFGQTVKICDLGWASTLNSQMKNTFCGTLDYVSPEMKDVGQYNESVDLWSTGVLTFQLLAGFPPFKHQISNWKLLGSKRKAKWSWEVLYPPEITPTAESFINHLLKQNPVERATVVQCKASFFIIRYRRLQESEYFNEIKGLFSADE